MDKKVLDYVMATAKKGIWIVFFFSFFLNMLVLTSPLYMMQVYDRVLTSGNIDTLVVLTLIAGFALFTLAALDAVRGFLMTRIGNWIGEKLLPFVVTGGLKSASHANLANAQGLRDLSSIRGYVSGPSMLPIFDIPFAPIFIIVLFVIHPILGWVTVGGALFLFILSVANDKFTRKNSDLSNNSLASLHNIADHSMRNSNVVSAMAMRPQLTERIQTVHDEVIGNQKISSDRGNIFSAIAKGSRFALQSLMLGLGAWLVIEGEMSPGTMIAGSILLGRALAPVEQAMGSWRGYISAQGSFDRVKKLIGNELLDPPELITLPEPEGHIRLDEVSYVPYGQQDAVLKSITLGIKAGDAIGLIGPSGSGKSTLAKLLCGSILPTRGHVRLDEADTAIWDEADRGQHIGYLPQEIELFYANVKENIAKLELDIDDEKVIDAAKRAHVHDIILQLPQGYETMIAGPGVLSAGQRQRIGLARAIYNNPQYVILDEPNSNLDNAGNKALSEVVETLKSEGRTVIIITHRPNILAYMDKVLVLKNGCVQDFGDSQEILTKFTEPDKKTPQIAAHGNANPEDNRVVALARS